MPSIERKGTGWRVKPNTSEVKRYRSKGHGPDREQYRGLWGVQSFATRAQAEFRKAELELLKASGAADDVRPVSRDSQITVLEFAYECAEIRRLNLKKEGRPVRPENHLRTLGDIERYLKGTPLASLRMVEVTRADTRRWVNYDLKGVTSRGMNNRTKQAQALKVRSLFLQWQRDGHAPLTVDVRIGPQVGWENPFDKADLPTFEQQKFTRLSDEEVDDWIAAAPDDCKAIMQLEAWSGARVSEALGIRAEDFKWDGPRNPDEPFARALARLARLPDARYRALTPTLTFQRKLDKNNRLDKNSPMKNKNGPRTLPLDDAQWLIQMIADHLARFPMGAPPYDGWIFCDPRTKKLPGRIVDRQLYHEIHVLKAKGLNDREVAKALGINRWPVWYWKNHTYHEGKRIGQHELQLMPYVYVTYLHLVADAARAAGLHHDVGGPMPRGQVTHALRHYCVTRLKSNGASDEEAGGWVGDSPNTVRAIYAGLQAKSLHKMGAIMSRRSAPTTQILPADASDS